MIDFPASPTVNQQFTAAGVTWIWDGAKWLPAGLAPTVVGGINDNRIINGDMRIDQRGVASTTSGTASGYTIDRWQFGGNPSAKINWQRGINSPSPSAGFPYSLVATSTSAYSAAAADIFIFYQSIEADQIGDFQWGTANAQTVTLSFWVYATKTGTFGGSLQNYAQTRSYPFSYSVPASNTWTKVAVTIPGDIGGTWVMSGNNGAAILVFDLGSGANLRGPAGAWASASYYSVTGAQSIVATNSAQLLLTGVKLEIGSVATPYNRQSLAKSMADCQRYFQSFPNVLVYNTYAPAGYSVSVGFSIPTMRAIPTITLTPATNIINCSGQVAAGYNKNLFFCSHNATAASYSQWTTDVSLSAEL